MSKKPVKSATSAAAAVAAAPNSVNASALKLEQHPLALQLTPGTMSDEEFDAFCEDLKRRGQQNDIVLYEGKILDGMHRYRGCTRVGITPKFKEYAGDDAAGLVIALNVLRRKLGSTQRALAGARLNMDFNMPQEEASKRVGVSKVHINLVAQALRSKNARLLKLLENPDLTRAALHEEMVDCGVVTASGPATPTSQVTAAGAAVGLPNSVFALGGESGGGTFDANDDNAADDLLGDDADDLLGTAPSAGGKVLDAKATRTSGDAALPAVGSRPSHPERRAKDTPAMRLAEAFKGLTEGDRISFMQIAWPVMRPLIKVAGLSVEPPPATVAAKAITKAAETAKAATTAAAPAPAAKKTAKGKKTAA